MWGKTWSVFLPLEKEKYWLRSEGGVGGACVGCDVESGAQEKPLLQIRWRPGGFLAVTRCQAFHRLTGLCVRQLPRSVPVLFWDVLLIPSGKG